MGRIKLWIRRNKIEDRSKNLWYSIFAGVLAAGGYAGIFNRGDKPPIHWDDGEFWAASLTRMTPVPLDPLLLILLGIFGLIFGSFVTALSYRLPRGESVAHGRSKCAACGHTLASVDLVPVASWVAQGGVCRYCRTKISWRYPAIEIVSITLFVCAGWLVGDNLAHVLVLLAMTPVMLALAVIDLEHQRLPNVPVLVLALLAVAWRWTDDGAIFAGLATAAITFGAGILLNAAYKAVTGKQGLGMDDTKLFVLAGVALPVGPFLLFIALAGILGTIFGGLWHRRTRASQFPFAPAILMAFWLCLAAGSRLIDQLVILRVN